MEAGTDGPPELNMSLDDIIAQNDKNKKLKAKGQHYGKSSGYQQNARGRGRGTRGRNFSRGGRFARGGRPQQQDTENYTQPERVVVVQEQAPNLEYRKVRASH